MDEADRDARKLMMARLSPALLEGVLKAMSDERLEAVLELLDIQTAHDGLDTIDFEAMDDLTLGQLIGLDAPEPVTSVVTIPGTGEEDTGKASGT